MAIRAKLKGLVHQELFTLEPAAKQAFRYALPEECLRRSFARMGRPLGSKLVFSARESRKWKLADGKTVYLVKDLSDRLVVIREKHPWICNILERVWYDAKPRYSDARWRFRRWYSQHIWAARKRWGDKPRELLINLGAGAWYAQNWKVLECHGHYYRYVPSFIDFEHDLTSDRPFPLPDNSVHLFYSEHVLEHFKDEWCAHVFREAHRCLKSGGGFRIVVPDADLIYDRLLQRDEKFFKSWMDRDNASLYESFRTLVGYASTPLDEAEFARNLSTMPKTEFLDWCKQGLEYDWRRAGEHINWFNFEKLERMLRAAGFSDIARCEAQQSRFPEARGPEFDTRAWYSLHVDCVVGPSRQTEARSRPEQMKVPIPKLVADSPQTRIDWRYDCDVATSQKSVSATAPDR